MLNIVICHVKHVTCAAFQRWRPNTVLQTLQL